MPAATAEPGTETIATPVETPQSAPAPAESAVDPAPAGQVTSPAADAPPEPVPPAPPKAIEDYTDDELASHPRLQGVREEIESRARQSERDKVTAETNTALRRRAREHYTRGGLIQDLNSLMTKALESGENVTPQQVQRSADIMYLALADDVLEGFKASATGLLGDYKLSAADADKLATIEAKVHAREIPHDQLLAEWTGHLSAAAEARGYAKGKSEAEKEFRKEQAAAAQARTTETEDAARSGSPSPSTVRGGVAATGPEQHRAILSDRSRIAEWPAAYKALHGIDMPR